MSIFQAILLGVLYYLANAYCFSYRYCAYMPIAAGFLTGVVLGNPTMGGIMGASIGLVYMGNFFVGGSVGADSGMAAIIGTAAAIQGNLDVAQAVAVAVPLGLVGNIVHYTRMTYFAFFVNLSDKIVNEGKEDKLIWTNVILPQITLFIICVVPVTLATYYGVDAIVNVVNLLSGKFLNIIGVCANMLPAIGISLTLSLIFKGEARPFFFVGYILVAVLGFSMVEASLAAVLMALIYNKLATKKGAE